jgi:hypothetical protein
MAFSGPPADGAPLSWNNAAGGSASVAANWNPVQMPAASDDLTFALNATYTVTFNAAVTASQTHAYRNGTVTLNMSSPHSTSSTVTIGSLSGDNPTVTLTTGTLTANANAVIGNSSGSAGALIVNDDDADFVVGNGADLIVGFNGDASLSVVGTGRVEVADQFIAGSNATSTPAVTISGFSIAPVNRSALDVLGTGESRIGQGGDAVMTIDSGGRAHFAGDVIIANGSASASIVNVQTSGLLDATLDVDGDLLIGRNSSAIAAGNGTLNVLIGGQVDVAGETLLGDPNGGVGTLHMDGGEFYGILDISVLAGSTINGTGTINADVANSGNIQPTGASGLTFNGILSNTTNNIAGTKIHFGATGGYTGSGTCQADITGNTTATITPTGPLTIGANTTSGYSYGGQLQVGAQSVTLRDSNGAVLGGLTTIDGGNVLCTAGIGIQNGARVLGVGTLSANVTNAGILEPDSGSAVPGILTVDGNLLVNPSSNMRFELNGPGNSHRINVSGSMTLNGTVTLTLAPGYLPTIGEQIILVNATAGRTGTFSTVVHTALCDQYTLVLVYSSTAAIALVRPGLAVTSVGDVDRDGDQDLDDFIRWSACLAGPGVLTPPPGCDPDDFAHRADLDGPACADYDVDLADYAVWQRILGN